MIVAAHLGLHDLVESFDGHFSVPMDRRNTVRQHALTPKPTEVRKIGTPFVRRGNDRGMVVNKGA